MLAVRLPATLEPQTLMSEETKLLVEAIESLRQDQNHFKDYIFPLVAGFFSSILGAGVAYLTIRHQDNSQIQKERVQTINDWVLTAESAIQSLISIKQNYHCKLISNPFQRTMEVRSLIGGTSKINKDFTCLSFLVPKKDEPDTQNVKWRQLPRIRAMIQNYNLIVDMWNKREEIERPIKEKIMHDNAGLAFAHVTREQIFSSVGVSNFTVLMDITERAIIFTDDLIIELNDFLVNFPIVGKSLIDKKYRDRYGSILTYSSKENPKLQNLMEKTIEVDYVILAELLGETEERIRAEYKTGY